MHILSDSGPCQFSSKSRCQCHLVGIRCTLKPSLNLISFDGCIWSWFSHPGHMILNTVDCTRPNYGRLPHNVDLMMSDFAGGASGFPMTFSGGKYTGEVDRYTASKCMAGQITEKWIAPLGFPGYWLQMNLNCISSLLISSSKHIGTDMRLLPSDVLLQCILRRRQGERKRGIKETQLRFTHWLVSISPCRELESRFHQEWKEEAHELQGPAGKILAAQDLLPVCRLLCRSTSLRQVLQNVYYFVYKFRSRFRLGFDPSYCFNCSLSI